MTISDAIWPGFSPDLLSIALVTSIQAKGTVLIHQKMIENTQDIEPVRNINIPTNKINNTYDNNL